MWVAQVSVTLSHLQLVLDSTLDVLTGNIRGRVPEVASSCNASWPELEDKGDRRREYTDVHTHTHTHARTHAHFHLLY